MNKPKKLNIQLKKAQKGLNNLEKCLQNRWI